MEISFSAKEHKEILNSWKDIARYLERGVRTVQRWEVELGLPVRRPHAKKRSTVVAFRSEIDQWLHACTLGAPNKEGIASASWNGEHGKKNGEYGKNSSSPVVDDLRKNIVLSRSLRSNLAHSRQQVEGAVNQLMDNLQAVMQMNTNIVYKELSSRLIN